MNISDTERQEFQQAILLLRSKNEALKDLRETMKSARADIAPLQSRVMEFMESKGVNSCNMGECRLVIEERNRMPAVTWKYLEHDVLPRFLDEGRMNELKKYIDDDRRSKMTTVRSIVQKPVKPPTGAAARAAAAAAAAGGMPTVARVPMPPPVVPEQSLHASIADLYA